MYLIYIPIQNGPLVGNGTNLIESLLFQTDDIQVKISPQAIGPVEIDSTGKAIPVCLVRKVEKKHPLILTDIHTFKLCSPCFWHELARTNLSALKTASSFTHKSIQYSTQWKQDTKILYFSTLTHTYGSECEWLIKKNVLIKLESVFLSPKAI